MKKYLSVLLSVLVILAFTATSVLAAPAVHKVTLVSVTYQDGGIVLIFETNGLTNADLKNNSFYADSNNQKMFCKFVDDSTTVRCTVSKSLAGKGDFHVTLAGVGFWGELPRSTECGDGEVKWYSILETIDGETYSGSVPQWLWDMAESEGWFDDWAAEFDYSIEITDHFCAPDIEPEPEPQ